jgi:hypothetical protein
VRCAAARKSNLETIMISFVHLLRHGALLAAATLTLAACASAPPTPFERDTQVDITATVESIDLETRLVSLRSADGRKATIHAGPAVRNLDQVKTGDQVMVSYYEAIGVEVTSADKATQGVEQDVAAVRAPVGSRPAGAIGETLTTTVEIESVDTSFNTVTFKRADGLERVIAIQDPEAQRFIRKLKRGDMVQITYMEAIAVSVQPKA